MNSSLIDNYTSLLAKTLREFDWAPAVTLAAMLEDCWRNGSQLFLCGNGGSAANAIHLANDLLSCVDEKAGSGIRAHALPANPSVITCLANDVGYENTFSVQLKTLGRADDLLIVLSGSGNSPNVVRALETAKALKIRTAAILGFDGGQCKAIAGVSIHFPVDDMQIVEDLQLIVGHMLMRNLCALRKPARDNR